MKQKYEGYFITSCGRVWSYYKNGFLNKRIKKGRNQASINGVDKLVSRLVAETYLPNPNNLPEVDHINNNKTDDRLINLQWIDKATNIKKEHNKKIKCVETGQVFNSQKEAADWCGRSPSNLVYAKDNPNKTFGGYHWISILKEEC